MPDYWLLFLLLYAAGVLSALVLIQLRTHFRARRAAKDAVQYIRFGQNSAKPAAGAVVGASIFELFRSQEVACEKLSLRRLPHLGRKAPRCYEMLGRAIGLLDAFSSCGFGCSKGDHVLERLVARAANNARAAVRLALNGFYDEALALTRSVGEIANLLSLFESSKGIFGRWKALDEQARRKEFSPVRVREELEKIGTPIRIATPLYAELSGRSIHVGPNTLPQPYNVVGRPMAGGFYQEAGFLVCLNEVAKPITFVIYAAAQLSHLDGASKQRLLSAGKDLISETGALGIEELPEMWKTVTSRP